VLRGRRWDAVVDPSGYVPRVVRRRPTSSARPPRVRVHLDRVGLPAASEDKSEAGPLQPLADPTARTCEPTTGPEGVLRGGRDGAFGDAALIVRSGLIVGPHDPAAGSRTGVRLARAARCSRRASRRARAFIDARDQVAWIRTSERRRGGPARPARAPRRPRSRTAQYVNRPLGSCGPTIRPERDDQRGVPEPPVRPPRSTLQGPVVGSHVLAVRSASGCSGPASDLSSLAAVDRRGRDERVRAGASRVVGRLPHDRGT